ncbi:MAG: type II toxin-antitoxin system RelE/ParE family toxin [Bacteroidota bacterium]|nr:type II toxin-antitoxin system RelE/ParE family toxin [Bacteroidota bacterium]
MNIEFTKEAVKGLDALERSQPKYFNRIVSKIQSLVDDPHSGKRLVGPLKGKSSMRVGDYRIIYEIVKTTIYILTINHRREVYK